MRQKKYNKNIKPQEQRMKDRNICKFIPSTVTDELKVSCFIFESNTKTMKQEAVLSQNRMILIKKEKAVFDFDGIKTKACTGTLVFGFEGEKMTVSECDGCEYMYIGFSGARCEKIFRRFGINRVDRAFSGFDGIIPLWQDSLSRASEENIDLASEGILLHTFSRLSGVGAEGSGLVNTVVEMTEERFVDPSLSVSLIAKELSYNPKYISHLFKEKMGMSYSEYLRMCRIKYAVSLFDAGLDSVKNIAYLSGFEDPLYFSTVFKKVVGVSPKDYKNKNKKEQEETE